MVFWSVNGGCYGVLSKGPEWPLLVCKTSDTEIWMAAGLEFREPEISVCGANSGSWCGRCSQVERRSEMDVAVLQNHPT